MRKPIFEAIKTARGGKAFTTMEVALLDSTLDTLGVPKEGEADPEPADAFTAALDEVLQHEGGYADHPRDPGGRTMLGVTQRVWEAWTGKPSNEAEMRSLTREKVAPLYRKNYWDAVEADKLPPPLALCVFDFGVNAGPGRAVRLLQRMVGVTQDGKVGQQTLAAVAGFVHTNTLAGTVKFYQGMRRDYYRSLSTFNTFGRGWLRRVDEVEKAALELVK